MMTQNRGTSNKNDCPVCQRPIRIREPTSLETQEGILSHLKHFRNKKQEFLICLSISAAQELITWRVVSIGTLTSSLVHPREVFSGPIEDHAHSIIIAQNHPSGNTLPSNHDIATTNQLIAGGILLGIPVIDHFILTPSSFFSFREHGLII